MVFVVADVVERSELGRVQKSAAAEAVEGQEISDFRGAQAQPEGTSDGAERAVGRIQVAKRPRRSQAGARGDIGHQAGLVANSASTDPVTTSMLWMALTGSCVEKTLLC